MLPDQSTSGLVEASLRRERETGEDSIPTVERVYPRSDSGAIMCVFPTCFFTRRDPVAMWHHVHGPAHRRSDASRSKLLRKGVLMSHPPQVGQSGR